jgi:hypothetical protein
MIPAFEQKLLIIVHCPNNHDNMWERRLIIEELKTNTINRQAQAKFRLKFLLLGLQEIFLYFPPSLRVERQIRLP